MPVMVLLQFAQYQPEWFMSNGKTLSANGSPIALSAGNTDVPGAAGISAPSSLNFSIAKVLAIFTVVTGHWFAGTILWIPVTFGLFVFAFSSAYFTSRIYGVNVDGKRFWTKKLERLAVRFWVTLALVAILLAFEGRTVFHWHTLLHFAALSGVLNWAAIPNQSALGAGLWFLSLLLLFYFSYPYLARLSQSKSGATWGALTATAVALFLRDAVHIGHELWLTALGFVLGVVYGLHEPRFRSRIPFFLAGLSCTCLLAVNLFSSFKQLNTALIAATCICISLWLSKATLPQWRAARALAKLEKYLLEIFIIHSYLFVQVSGNSVLDFGVSVLLTVAAAIAVNQIARWLSSLAFGRSNA